MCTIVSLPPEVEKREKRMAQFSASFAMRLPQEIRATAFCSPVSFREPEIDNAWHPYMIKQGFLFFLWDQMPKFLRAFAGGMKRFIYGRFGHYIFIPREGAVVLGLGPINICKLKEGGVETNYCHPDDAAQMSWLIADDAAKDHQGYPITRLGVVKMFFKMFFCWGAVSFFSSNKDTDWATASVLTLQWIISLRWADKWIWGLKIREILQKMRPEKVYCVHEMHPHARIVWSEARRAGIPTITIQHASITRTKLWYFPTPEELKAGLATPDEFVVFSEMERALLEPFYPKDTRFHFGCGPRFSHWQGKLVEQREEKADRAPIFFAGSAPWWDNEVILKGVRKLAVFSKGRTRPIIVRLHPAAVVPRSWKQWLRRMSKRGRLCISGASLSEDLSHAAVVIGMNTTVMDEGMLMGLPVIALRSDRYLSFASGLGTPVLLDQLSWEIIEQYIATAGKHREENMRQGRQALGIDRPVFKLIPRELTSLVSELT